MTHKLNTSPTAETLVHDFRYYDHCEICARIAATMDAPPTPDELKYGADECP